MLASLSTYWDRLRQQFTPQPRVDPSQLNSPDSTVRWRTVRDMHGHPLPAYVPTLLRLLDDPDPIIRDEAVLTLGSWGHEHSLRPALAALHTSPNPQTTAALLDLLALLPDPASRSTIVSYLSAKDPEVRTAAVRALGALGSTSPPLHYRWLCRRPRPARAPRRLHRPGRPHRSDPGNASPHRSTS